MGGWGWERRDQGRWVRGGGGMPVPLPLRPLLPLPPLLVAGALVYVSPTTPSPLLSNQPRGLTMCLWRHQKLRPSPWAGTQGAAGHPPASSAAHQPVQGVGGRSRRGEVWEESSRHEQFSSEWHHCGCGEGGVGFMACCSGHRCCYYSQRCCTTASVGHRSEHGLAGPVYAGRLLLDGGGTRCSWYAWCAGYVLMRAAKADLHVTRHG